MSVAVDPTEFTFVDYDAGRIGEIATEVAGALGFDPTTAIVVEVDERMPFGNHELRSLDPIHCFMESGLIEHSQRIRKLSEEGAREAIGRLLVEARDRLDSDFGAPPLGEVVDVAPRVAWDVYSIGRLVRLGGRNQRQRRLYQFRNQHGFDDRADSAFGRLWTADSLTYAEIREISDDARQSAA
jgi:hypothetical protein